MAGWSRRSSDDLHQEEGRPILDLHGVGKMPWAYIPRRQKRPQGQTFVSLKS